RLAANVGIGLRFRKRSAHKFVRRSAEPWNFLKGLMTQSLPAEIAGLYRYPVKGLTPEALQTVALRPGQTLPADRRYAIENGPSGFDPAQPAWLPKTVFLMLMRDEWLAALQAHFDDRSNVLTLRENGAVAVEGNLETEAGRAAIERFFAERHAARIKGPPKVLVSPGHSFSDVANKVVSIINLESLAAIEDMVGGPVHPLRFRANVYVRAWPAWHEAGLLGETIRIGAARLKVVKRITRCAAVNVDPDLAVRDMEIPSTLMRRFGNNECGIYAEVIEGGSIAVGDKVVVEAPALL